MLWDRLPTWPAFICTFLTWAIPWSIYQANKKLHQIGDPAWKATDSSNSDKEDESSG